MSKLISKRWFIVCYVLVAIYFIAFIFSNIKTYQQYLVPTNKWAPKRSKGPYLYQVSETNPSKYARDYKESLMVLGFLQQKKVYTNITSFPGSMYLYMRFVCKYTGQGEFQFTSYLYECSDIVVVNIEKYRHQIEACRRDDKAFVSKNTTICEAGLNQKRAAGLFYENDQYVLLGIDGE